MTQLALSNDLLEITAEINVYKQQAGQAVFEIGKRLKHVRDNDLAHGQWEAWLVSIDLSKTTAWSMIQTYEQFSNVQSTEPLPTGKMFEMLTLPQSVDRQDFVNKQHTIPSSGDEKNVHEMTQRELREVTKALKETERQKAEAERRAAEAEAKAATEETQKFHYQKLYNQEKQKPAQIKVREVEKVPDDYEQVIQDHQRLNNENVKLHRTNQELVQQLTEAKFTDTSLRKVKEKCVEIMRDLTGNHNAMMLELSSVQGHPDAMKLIDEYSERLNNFVNMAFQDLNGLSQVKQTKGGIDVEYTVVSD